MIEPVDVHDARRVRHAPEPLRAFNDAGVLAAADVHVALRLMALGAQDDPVVALAAALAVRGPRLGHVYVDLATIAEQATVDADEPVDLSALPWPAAGDWTAALARSALVAIGEDGDAPQRPLRLSGTRLYLDRYWREERRLAADLLAFGAQAPGGVAVELLADGLRRLFPGSADERQRVAAATATLRRLTVVAGGPGTGKTTTVARILALLGEQAASAAAPAPLVALAAPTGKAAARLQEAVHAEAAALATDGPVRAWLLGLDGSTLHRLLGWRPGSHSRFRHDRANRLAHDVVVVDETSMVSLSLMARLVEAVRPGARLILVGDPGQLTSIEAGAVLGDIVGPAAAGPRMREPARRALEAVLGRGGGAAAPPPGGGDREAAPLGRGGAAAPAPGGGDREAAPLGRGGAAAPAPGGGDREAVPLGRGGAAAPAPGGGASEAAPPGRSGADGRPPGGDPADAAPPAGGAPASRPGGAAAPPSPDAAVGDAFAPSPDAAIGDAIVVLDRSHRFGPGIAALAEAVRAGDADATLAALRDRPDEVTWIAADVAALEDPDALAIVRDGAVAAAGAVIAAAAAGDAEGAIAAIGAFRVLCAHRRGEHGAATWRARVEAWLAGAIDGFATQGEWYVGRPLLVTENDYGLRLYNGDTGVVVAAGQGKVAAAFERHEQLLSPARLAAVETVYAMTIHKAQGSQFHTAAVLLPPASSPILTRELLYTAVTRARTRLIVAGGEDAVRAAVQRPVARASGLRARLWGEVEDA